MLLVNRDPIVVKIMLWNKDYLLGFIIHLVSYLVAITAKRGNLVFQPIDFYLLLIIMSVSFIFSILLEKYHNRRDGTSFNSSLKYYFYSFLLSLGVISLLITLFFQNQSSRYVVLGAMVVSFAIECIVLLVRKNFRIETNLQYVFEFSILNFSAEIIIFFATTLLFIFITPNRSPSIVTYPFIYASFFLIWLSASLLVHGFKSLLKIRRYWAFIWERVKTYIIFISVVSLLYYAFNINIRLREELILLSAGYSVFAIVIFTVTYIFIRQSKTDEIKSSLRSITEYKDNLNYAVQAFNEKCISPIPAGDNTYLREQLNNVYLKKFPGVYEFMETTFELTTFDLRRCMIIRSADSYNIEILPVNYVAFYLNLHEINDISKINEYFLKINQRLLEGGYYIGRLEPTHLRFERFFRTYPYQLARLFYFFDFMWKRVLPNLPLLRKIYFAFTKGKKRAISFPEALGRLYYCGFQVCNYRQIDNYIYFIGRKIFEPELIGNPLYGPLIKLKRVGRYGKIINIYKFRTMHPYSEYIQKFVYEINHLAQGGKIKNDFRITAWGKVLRKLWLDEFPMFLNLFKGNLKLVGVRPISLHYFSLYDKDLQEMRTKYKPGIFPPFYYDLPKTFAEIMESEKRYLASYEKSPFFTDVRYLFTILYNILIKKARSN